jgi:hypothetical protein
MKITFKEIYFPPICDKSLTAKLHFLENPKIEKKVMNKGNIELTYEQSLRLQRDIIIDTARNNSVLLDMISGKKKIFQSLEEISMIDNFPHRYLPRKKNPEWNKYIESLQKLIGIEYSEKPRFKKDYYEAHELCRVNYFIMNNLAAKGIFNASNPITCSLYMAIWNWLIAMVVFLVAGHLANIPFLLMSFVGIFCGSIFGLGLGAAVLELTRGKLPYNEAKYLDFKQEELKISPEEIACPEIDLIAVQDDLPEWDHRNMLKIKAIQTKKMHNF